MAALRLAVGDRELTADWTGENPRTRDALADALPIAGNATRWGDELYFGTDVDVPAEDAREAVPVGAVAYWPQGDALCLFWGPTPASRDDEPRAASPVNVVARVEDVASLERLDGGARAGRAGLTPSSDRSRRVRVSPVVVERPPPRRSTYLYTSQLPSPRHVREGGHGLGWYPGGGLRSRRPTTPGDVALSAGVAAPPARGRADGAGDARARIVGDNTGRPGPGARPP
jgi:hypothetical protein